MNIFDFKLYVFDLDGVIINSEKFPRAEDPLYNRSIFISEIKDYNYF